jgi:hypothetical protein
MKMYFLKPAKETVDVLDTATVGVEAALTALHDFSVPLTLEERRWKRKMGPRRFAYATEAARKGKQFEAVMPRTFVASSFADLLDLCKKVADLLGKVEELQESLDDTLMALGIDAMTFTKLVHDGLRSANLLDPRYDSPLAELDEFNKLASREDAEEEQPLAENDRAEIS